MKHALLFVTLLATTAAHATDKDDKGNKSHKPTTQQGQGQTQGQGQGQGQIQGQGQGQGQTSTNNSVVSPTFNISPTSIATGGQGGRGGKGGKGGSVASSNNSSQSTVVQAAERNTSSAYAPTIAPTALCMGSTSGGVQGASFGVSLGGTWTDTNCMLLEQVRTVSIVLNDPILAAEMMCGMDAYREARIRIGKPCISTKSSEAAQPKPEYTDPIIRSRLGLPPLK